MLGEQLRALRGPILITGHTGFKGSWLTMLLEHLGVATVGYSLPPEKDSLYDRAKLGGKIPEIYADIRDSHTFRSFLAEHQPSAVIHMAAQSLVLKSYERPRETFDVNVMGTVNVLDESFLTSFVQAVIVVTTDKVYRNDNMGQTFIETDPLGGKDPYSASKVGAESAVSAWQQIQKISGGPNVASVRAGNVIGGGDWAENRLIPDIVRGFISGSTTEIRNPESTRPWQHVLDPLAGYLMTLNALLQGVSIPSINFAPSETSYKVRRVVSIAQEEWGLESRIQIIQNENHSESIVLNLDATKALQVLGWSSTYNQENAIRSTIRWWKDCYLNSSDPKERCIKDILDFSFSDETKTKL